MQVEDVDWGRTLIEMGLTSVNHRVETGLGKDGHLSWRQGSADQTCPILLDEICIGSAGHSDDVIGRSRMIMRWEHCTWAQRNHGHRHTVPYYCRKACYLRKVRQNGRYPI